MKIIDGKNLSNQIKEQLKKTCEILKEKGITPGLGVILVGEDSASQTYVSMKEKACKTVGINSYMYRLPSNTEEKALLNKIEELNNDKNIHGILVQLPLPKQINTTKILEAIDVKKDVDGFHALNVGYLVDDREGFVPCTPLGVMRLLKEYNINPTGLHACIVGASSIVGKPMQHLLTNIRATTTICHSKTKNLASHTKSADLIVVGVGKPNLIRADMVKKGAIVIDVGINRLENGKLVGDVDFEAVSKKCSFITPVPGGVGPMTIAMLLSNTIKSAQNQI